MDYKEIIRNLKIELVYFDNGATPESMAAYVLVSNLQKTSLKDKGNTALDLGNAIYNLYGIRYQMCPEYHRQNEPRNSLAFYISKRDMEAMPHVQDWLLELYNKGKNKTKRYERVLYETKRITIYESK